MNIMSWDVVMGYCCARVGIRTMTLFLMKWEWIYMAEQRRKNKCDAVMAAIPPIDVQGAKEPIELCNVLRPALHHAFSFFVVCFSFLSLPVMGGSKPQGFPRGAGGAI